MLQMFPPVAFVFCYLVRAVTVQEAEGTTNQNKQCLSLAILALILLNFHGSPPPKQRKRLSPR